MKSCSIQGCVGKYKQRGYCHAHYNQYLRPDYKKEWYQGNRKHCLKYAKEYAENNHDKVQANHKNYRTSYRAERKITKSAWDIKNSERVRKKNRRPKVRFNGAKCHARYPWSITFEQFSSLLSFGCFYCGKSTAEETGSSLDRIDNGGAYSIDNVLPCCGKCNKTRGDRYDVQEMIVMINALSLSKSDSIERLRLLRETVVAHLGIYDKVSV